MAIQIIEQAIRENKDIEFIYTKYYGETSRRRVSNINYCNEYGEFGYYKDHIKGYCHLRKENRTFRISRMSDIKLYLSTNKVFINTQTTYQPTQPIDRSPQPTYSTSQQANKSQQQNYRYPQQNRTNQGCYIATMVYGDYNHPKVLFLREYRDEKLSKTLIGKTFIFFYYKISPILVANLERNPKANKIIKRILERIIKLLNK